MLLPVLHRPLEAPLNVFDVMHHAIHEQQISNAFRWLLETQASHRLEDMFLWIFIEAVNRGRSRGGRPRAGEEEVAVLDEIFGNPTDLAIAEPTTDTAGQTLATFAIFDLAGLQFSPRIRDIGRLQLYRIGAGPAWRARYPHAGALLTQPIQTRLMSDHWDGLLRLVGR